MEKSTPYRNAWYRDLLEKEKELKEYTDNAISAIGDITKVKFIDISLKFPSPVDIESTAVAYYGIGIDDESKKIINGETSFFNLSGEELSNYDLIILNIWLPAIQISGRIIKLQIPAILNGSTTDIQLVTMEIGATLIGYGHEVYMSIGTTIETAKDLISFGRNKTTLPIASVNDNGKVLSVVNGEWAISSLPSSDADIIVVPIDFRSNFDSFSLVGMTTSELSSLCERNKDKLIVLKDSDSNYPPLYRIFYEANPSEPVFGTIKNRTNNINIMVYRFWSGSTNVFKLVSELSIPKPTAENNGKFLGVTNGYYKLVDAPSAPTIETFYADEIFTLKTGITFPGYNGYYINNNINQSRGGSFTIIDNKVLLYDFSFSIPDATTVERDTYGRIKVFGTTSLFNSKILEFVGNNADEYSDATANFYNPYGMTRSQSDPDILISVTGDSRLQLVSSEFVASPNTPTPSHVYWRYQGMLIKNSQ